MKTSKRNLKPWVAVGGALLIVCLLVALVTSQLLGWPVRQNQGINNKPGPQERQDPGSAPVGTPIAGTTLGPLPSSVSPSPASSGSDSRTEPRAEADLRKSSGEAEKTRSRALFPKGSELGKLQQGVDAGHRPDLKDPRRVAEEYLKERYSGTLASQKGEFGLGSFLYLGEEGGRNTGREAGQGTVDFAGAHDVAPGTLQLRSYHNPSFQPNDIWYVDIAATKLMSTGGDAWGDSYEGNEFRQYLILKAAGTLDILIEAVGESRPIMNEVMQVRSRQVVPIKRTFPRHYLIHLRAELRTTDGKVGVFETYIS